MRRCHNHKFDPIPTADYYALAGIFKSTKTMADLGFVSNWNERSLPTKAIEADRMAHQQKIDAAEKQVVAARDKATTELARSVTGLACVRVTGMVFREGHGYLPRC